MGKRYIWKRISACWEVSRWLSEDAPSFLAVRPQENSKLRFFTSLCAWAHFFLGRGFASWWLSPLRGPPLPWNTCFSTPGGEDTTSQSHQPYSPRVQALASFRPTSVYFQNLKAMYKYCDNLIRQVLFPLAFKCVESYANSVVGLAQFAEKSGWVCPKEWLKFFFFYRDGVSRLLHAT